MVILLGLGNPGPAYAGTRHNIGFRILDLLARDHRLEFSKREALCLAARGRIAGRSVLLAKPLTFMNCSGEAADKLRTLHEDALEDFLVLYDDLDLPFGQLRLRASGGPGTHNGMRSIVQHWGGRAFPRLRFGIGPARGDAADFVLSAFDPDENGRLPELLDRAARGVERFLAEGPERAMGWINPRPEPADLEP
jgi:peptidyl-tRNA hydrolase, PTH1 family